ncbi:UPF0158 family protein [Micromonospora sp. FIMYZ51]|uniref:UPF0158 family protein n=1 Tax=Micromonospora sp. FIMYZ51 TaxID=3051832 RepID=UPI00311ECE80
MTNLSLPSGLSADQRLSREKAFGRLIEVVTEMQRSGRSTKSAGVKPRLTQSLDGRFNEADYGFSTFREFLTAAQQAGLIELRTVGPGPDVDVIVPDESTTSTAVPAGRIRPDLWSTFMDWSPGIERLYDRREQRARRLVPASDAEDTDSEMRALREARTNDPDRFLRIDPVVLATQLSWARTFVASLESTMDRKRLTEDLNTERPMQEFTRRIRTMSIAGEWASFRNRQVADVIRAWADKNEINLDPFAPPSTPPVAIATPRTSATHVSPVDAYGPAEINVKALRAQVKDLVDRMTVEELLALPFTLGQLYRR